MNDAATSFDTAAAPVVPSGSWRKVGRRLRRDKLTLAVLVLLAVVFTLTIFAPVFASHDPYVGDILERLKPLGTPGHFLGTDDIGRDMWSRLLYGARLSLLFGLLPVGVALLIGGTLGLLAGFAGGAVATLIMRTADVFYAFPPVLVAIALTGVLGGGFFNTLLSLALVFIAPLVRITEAITIEVAAAEFVVAARSMGAGAVLILWTQVLGNVIGPVLSYATSLISTGILLGAGLSFLGYGVPPPQAEWGAMLNELRQSIYVDPILTALPGAAIVLTSLCFNLASDGLRAALDLRLEPR